VDASLSFWCGIRRVCHAARATRRAEYCDESPAWWSGADHPRRARTQKISHFPRGVRRAAAPILFFSPSSGERRAQMHRTAPLLCSSRRALPLLQACVDGRRESKRGRDGKAARGIPIPIPILTEEEEVSRQRCRARGRPRDRPSSGAHMGAPRGWQAGTGGKRQHRGVPSRRPAHHCS